MAERRSSKRTTGTLKVWCEGDDYTLLCRTLNVSREGLFLRTSRPLELGARVRLVANELGLSADGEVRWVRASGEPGPAGAGIAIGSVQRGRDAFERFVDQCTSRSGEHRVALAAHSDRDDEP
jgi:hypothetical protein